MTDEAKATPLFSGTDWTPELLSRITDECAKIAKDELRLDWYPIQIEIITSEQMIDAISAIGLPVHYRHWSYGKLHTQYEKAYRAGRTSLAYEMVINSSPCIVYCMEKNTAAMQATVIAHAAFGHNHFFKNNYLFKQWTNPRAIIDYAIFAKNFVRKCEERYGVEEVERVLDACHALRNHGFFRYGHPPELSLEEEEARLRDHRAFDERHYDVLWEVAPEKHGEKEDEEKKKPFPAEPQENILYFIEKHAPELPVWKREIIRIVRKIAQYFYPQMHTKVLHEGFATFVHYYIMTRLSEKGLVTNGAFLEFLGSHTNIVFQPEYDETRKIKVKIKDPETGEEKEGEREAGIYGGINPYALGFKIFTDVKRICEEPTDEDREWFPDLAGKDWCKAVKDIVAHYKDESGIRQFLSPKAMRDLRLFSILDDDKEDAIEITAVSRDDGAFRHDGYRHVRSVLADMFDPGLTVPNIEVTNVDRRGNRMLTLTHNPVNRISLDKGDTRRVLDNVRYLWEFPVRLKTIDRDSDEVIFLSKEGDDEYDEDDE